MLTEEQGQHFYREGYVVVPALVPPAAVEAVVAAAPEPVDGGKGWQPTIFNRENPHQDAAVHRLLAEPNIVEAVTDIFGAAPRVFYGMLAVVPGQGGSGLPWHQDNQYDQLVGSALNTFVALCDIPQNKAILWVAPRSHLLGVQPAKESELYGADHREAATEPANGVPLPAMKAGDVCIFDRNTLHRSLKNETNEPRYAYAAQYTSVNARLASDGKLDPNWLLAEDLARLWCDDDSAQAQRPTVEEVIS